MSRSSFRIARVAGVGILMLMLAAGPATADGVSAEGNGNAVIVAAREAKVAEDAWITAKASADPAANLVEYARADLCEVASPILTTPLNGPCPNGGPPVPVPNCGPDLAPLLPLWTRTRTTPTTPWTPWTSLTGAACPQDVLPAFTTEDFQRLPLTPTPTTIQPSTATILVNYGIIATADPTPQDLTTTLLGYPLTIHATPTTYTWDFGDGSPPLTTTTPGQPYTPTTNSNNEGSNDTDTIPTGSHTYPYPHPGTYTLTLTTTWTGTYQLTGTTTTHPITGTATTTTTHPPLTATTRHTHLTATTCHTTPTPPGC